MMELTIYDPLTAPNATAWLALDEGERMMLIIEAHKGEDLDEQQLQLHSSGHLIVENQLALEDPEVVLHFNRLMKEGLDRHNALHACAALVMEMMFNLFQTEQQNIGGDPNTYYKKRLVQMTAEKWLNQDY